MNMMNELVMRDSRRDSLIGGAGRCSAGFRCTGIPASSSAHWSAAGFAGSATQRWEGPRCHSPARCPSTTSDVTKLPGRVYRCPAVGEQAENM